MSHLTEMKMTVNSILLEELACTVRMEIICFKEHSKVRKKGTKTIY